MCLSKQREYALSDLRDVHGEGRLLVAVREKVLDLTEFSLRHPGGEHVLSLSAGRDATQVFETYHPLSVMPMLDKFCVGRLVSHELPTFPEPGPFFRTVKERVEEHFRTTGKDPKWSPWMAVRYFFIFGTIFTAWLLTLCVDSLPLQLLLQLPLGFCCALVGLMPMHDSSHLSFSHSPCVWRTLGHSHDFVNGASYVVWMYQHVLGHHPYTNIDGADPDIVTSENDVRRIKLSQPWFVFYLQQHIYVPLLYAVLGIKTRLQDIQIMYFTKMNGAITVNNIGRQDELLFWMGKAFFVAYRFLLPLALGLSFGRVLALFAVSDAITSYWLALTFQANHVVGEVEWPLPNSKGMVERDWAEHQVATTQDYAHDSWFWNVFSGALNHQTTHHLVPWVLQYHYPAVTPIIRKTCEEFGVKFNYKATFGEALGSHINFLHSMGQEKQE